MKKEQVKKTYSRAPYNFIPFSAVVPKVAERVGELPAHNEINDELFSGKINLDIMAATDIFVGGSTRNGREEELFATDFQGREVIPGSTLRGLVRSNMQILGFSSVAGDVEDYAIMYRRVGSRGTKLARQYNKEILGVKPVSTGKGRQVSLPLNVEAGYITCENGEYYIYSAGKPIDEKNCGNKMNYYSISEQAMLMDSEHFDIDLSKTQYIIEAKTGERKPSFRSRNDYAPYAEEVFFRPSGRTVSSVRRNKGGEKAPSGYRKGYLVSTGFMNKKKMVYIIPLPEVSEIEKEKISPENIRAFKRDYTGRRNTLHGTKCRDKGKKEQAREFYNLPVPGKTKPVFFMRHNGRTYFGFTPYARVFYEKSLYAGLPDEHKQSDRIDYVSSILGFSDSGNGESYKSRVFFEDAVIKEDKGNRTFSFAPGEPKLSSCYDYVVQNDRFGKTYNDDFELRGIKQYWLHEKATDSDKRGTNENVTVSVKAKKAGCSFSTVIHFKNLRKAELGLLLSCIYLGENYQQNIGRAKAYGFGRIDIAMPKVFLLDYKKMYSMLSLNVFEEIRDISGYVEAYKEEIRKKYKLSFNQLKDFYLMKDKERMPEEEAISYMELPEYSNRKEALPTVEQVLEGKRGQIIENAPSKNSKSYFNGKGQAAGKNSGDLGYSSASDENLKRFTGQFRRYDRKTRTVFFQVNGKEKTERVDALKGIRYEKMKQGDAVIVEKQGNNFFLI